MQNAILGLLLTSFLISHACRGTTPKPHQEEDRSVTKEVLTTEENIPKDFEAVPTSPATPAPKVVLEKKQNLGLAQSEIQEMAVHTAPRMKRERHAVRPFVDVKRDRITHNTEEYDLIKDNQFKLANQNPLSTFSIDVDAASYTNTRRFLNNGQLPYKDAVRVEEFINYFDYDYPEPHGRHPFSVTTELSQAPWNAKHQLLHLGLQGKNLDHENLEPSNLVFLLDVSGSMNQPNKLPLLKSAFKLLLKELSSRDRVAIVAYAGAAGLVLPSTPATEKETILSALDNLKAGGSTAGGAGIHLAYKRKFA